MNAVTIGQAAKKKLESSRDRENPSL